MALRKVNGNAGNSCKKECPARSVGRALFIFDRKSRERSQFKWHDRSRIGPAVPGDTSLHTDSGVQF